METDILIYLGGLALLDTLSPTIIGVVLFLILTDNNKLTSRVFTYLFTVVVLYFSLGIILLLGLNYITEAFSNVFQNKSVSWAIFVLGAILFTVSFFMPTNKKSNIPKPKSLNLISILLVGLTTFLIEAGTALPYFAALGLLTNVDIPYYQTFSIIAIYNIIMVAPALLIFLGYKIFGKALKPALATVRSKLANSSNSALSWMVCIVGILLIFYTIDYL